MENNSMKKILMLLIVSFLFYSNIMFAGITGKITGRITDAESGEPLVGVNILINGTQLGAATDLNGNYVILNIPPGTYTLKVTMIGYAKVTATDVVVVIDLTTTFNLQMSMEVMGIDEVVIVAERPIVAKDISASQMNIGADIIESLPVQRMDQVIGLQAGVEEGMEVRGSSARQSAVMLDGFTLNDERSNAPFTEISLSSIKEIQIQTGGFNAEYGNVRSGIITAITKEGDRNRYHGTVSYLFRPAGQKHFGSSLYGTDTYFTRPYTDPAVCWEGTQNGAWDTETQRQYPIFEGWSAVSEKTLQDNDPANDLTPEGAKRLWEWQHRRQGDITKPDIYFDGGFGGPVPIIGKKLGDLRFFATYKQDREMFIVPLSRDNYGTNSTQLKLVSDISQSMKLIFTGMYGEIHSVSPYSWTTTPTGWVLRTPQDVVRQISGGVGNAVLYVPGHYSPSSIYRNMIGVKFTHVLSPKTFYEINLQNNINRYSTFQVADRDTSRVYETVSGYFVDEAPYGYWGYGGNSIGDNMRIGGWMNLGRDRSVNSTTSLRFDYTSQVNFRHHVKTGLHIVYNDFAIRSSTVNPSMSTWNRDMIYDQFPFRIGAYIQDKLEFEGFVANVGLRLDYSDANGDYYDLAIYDQFYQEGIGAALESEAPTKETKSHFYLSPRLGISHPITVNSKLYFNYGHFFQEPASSYRFRIQRESNGLVTYLGNPNLKLEKTVAYEVGYEQNLFDVFLLRLAAYYKDITNQPNWVYYQNFNSAVQYQKAENNDYEDIRGFELTLTKRAGRWLTGFINYTYHVETHGYFGLENVYEDPLEQRKYLKQNPYLERPRARPFARANIDLHSPTDFGPQMFGFYPFEKLYLIFLAEWRAGRYETYNPNQIPGIVDNVQWQDYYNVDLRFSKVINFAGLDIQCYLDVTNALNLKYMVAGLMDYKNYAGFSDVYDYEDYLASLHFSWEKGEQKGNDRVGEYKKDYIDMPNLKNLLFLNPRSIKFGIKMSF